MNEPTRPGCPRALTALFTVAVTMSCALPAAGEAARPNPWENPENLQVLPEDIAPGDLRQRMRTISLGTGIRCGGCHLRVDDAFDFPSDAEPRKEIARRMMRMVEDVNGRVAAAVDQDAAATVPVRCVTCHRGQARPELIQDVLDRTIEEEGIAAAMERYEALRAQYRGSHTFDFDAYTLADYADLRAQTGDAPSAFALHEMNLRLNPEDARAWSTRALTLTRAGRFAEALADYEHALALSPDAVHLEQRIARLRARMAAEGDDAP